MNKNKIIELKKIEKVYKMGTENFKVLKEVDLIVNEGEFLSVLGPSGSGKSTLMNILGCLDSATTGEYYLNDTLVSSMNDRKLSNIRNRQIGFIFQSFHLLPRLSALKNVELSLNYSKISKKERLRRAKEALDKVGLQEKYNYRPNQLSGGQQQRVAIARALANNPTILLADEPTGALDQETGKQIMMLFEQLHKEGKTILMITHDQKIAQYGDRVIEILDGELFENRGVNNV